MPFGDRFVDFRSLGERLFKQSPSDDAGPRRPGQGTGRRNSRLVDVPSTVRSFLAVQSYPVLPILTVERTKQRLIDVAADLGGAALGEANQLAVRLVPDLWPLEWHLPVWLGVGFGLDETVWQQLVHINLLGMAYVRLADDLADAALDEPQRAVKNLLGRRLLETSTELLRSLFLAESPFWRHYEAYLDQWRQAGESENLWRDGPRERLVTDWRWLAWRGAPGKITATAACLLAGRAAAIAPLELCVDHIMAATVLLDHADDWQEDLAGGQFNAYVTWLSGLPQHAENVDRNRRQVLSALMQGDGDDHHSYFDLIDQHLQRAQQFAGQVGSAGLCAYIEAFRRTAREQSAGQLAAARKTYQDALASLLAGFATV